MIGVRENQPGGSISLAEKNTDVVMALAVVSIVGFMTIPLPPMLLDILLSFSITFSLMMLLLSMYIQSPLEISAFPSILLLITLFRLALNIASTRIILLHGNEGTTAAGKVIYAFGNFAVGGNYVVGAIVFIILVIINFVVITKGAGRIAEVAARFTLDAMPGKQMSIDADLNAGLIDDKEAKERRSRIAQEADFHGAMDGASKFVRGDAVAGLIIAVVNVVGGLTIGVLQNDMSFSDAAKTYTLLTVGDGLVTQIPALLLSTAAGIVVSRASGGSNLGHEVVNQLLLQPRAIAMAAGILFFMALVPGLPTVPFLVLSVAAGTVAYLVIEDRKVRQKGEKAKEAGKVRPPAPERISAVPPLDALALEVGYGLVPLVDTGQGGELLERIKSIRKQIAQEIGIIVPPVHIQDNLRLKPNQYSILLKENEIGSGELMLNHFLAMNPGLTDEKIDGIVTQEPTYGLPALWIREERRDEALAKGFTVVDIATVLTTHLADVIRRYGHELIGRQEVQKLLDHAKETHPKVVEELVPNLLPLGSIVKVLQNLLREQVSVRDLLTVLETLADVAPMTKDIDVLSEYVRQAMARTITKSYQAPDGTIPVITFDQQTEKIISGAIQQTEQGYFLVMEPAMTQRFLEALHQNLEKCTSRNYQPIVLCSPQIRLPFKRFIDRFVPNLVVLSFNEILTNVKIQTLGTVRIGNAH
ncbi:MAG TPA: flagellar biosynthesis protein FlhA [Thermodesulfobacteriota bacterium]|nr:flagellar biosynthesis protein FlhA [Thermodesulfobacteriota bacterium]HQO77290.1 flagellar biosynthesis protein FlhA [Thermodesulfobacteriota bacterium]